MTTNKMTTGRPSQRTGKKSFSLDDLKNNKELARANFYLPKEDYKKLKQYAIEQETSITEILAGYIHNLVNE